MTVLDRNGDPVVMGNLYVPVGEALAELADGRVVLDTQRARLVDAAASGNPTVALDSVDIVPLPAGGGGASDHGALTGLGDDDHAQYHTDARGDARYSPLGHTHAQLHDPVTVADSSSIDLSLTGQQISAAAIFGSGAGTVCQGNDARLSDARTPTAHTHSGADINSGTVASARLPDATSGAKGAVVVGTGSSTTVPTMGDHQDAEDLANAGLPMKFTTSGTVPAHTQAHTTITGLGTAATLNHGLGLDDLPKVSTCIAAFAPVAHAHAAADVTSGVFAPSRIYTLVATLASNAATGANTTPINLTGLVWTFEANSTYFFEWRGRVQPAAATTGCGFQLDVSVAITEIAMQFYHQLANTGTSSSGHSVADDASVGVSSGMPGTSGYTVTGDGMLRTSASGGTAQLRFRSETTAVTTALAGMTLVVRKVA